MIEKLEKVLAIAQELPTTRPLDMPGVFDKMKELLEEANAQAILVLRDKFFLEIWNMRYARARSYLTEMYPQRVIRGQDELIKRVSALKELVNDYMK